MAEREDATGGLVSLVSACAPPELTISVADVLPGVKTAGFTPAPRLKNAGEINSAFADYVVCSLREQRRRLAERVDHTGLRPVATRLQSLPKVFFPLSQWHYEGAERTQARQYR